MNTVGVGIPTVRNSALHVALDTAGELVSLECRPQRTGIRASLRPSALQTGLIELVLMGKQPIVHYPEGVRSAQHVHSLGGFRGILSMRMNVAEREVSKDRPKRLGLETSQPGKG